MLRSKKRTIRLPPDTHSPGFRLSAAQLPPSPEAGAFLTLPGAFDGSEPGAGLCFPLYSQPLYPPALLGGYTWMKEYGHIQIRSIPFQQYMGYRLLRPHPPLKRSPFPRGEGNICGSCLSVTVPFTHSSHRPQLLVQSPTAPLFTALLTQLRSKSCWRYVFWRRLYGQLAGAGAKPQHTPFQDQLPIFSKTPFPCLWM